MIFCSYGKSVIFTTKFKEIYTFNLHFSYILTFVGSDVKWCSVSKITTPFGIGRNKFENLCPIPLIKDSINYVQTNPLGTQKTVSVEFAEE